MATVDDNHTNTILYSEYTILFRWCDYQLPDISIVQYFQKVNLDGNSANSLIIPELAQLFNHMIPVRLLCIMDASWHNIHRLSRNRNEVHVDRFQSNVSTSTALPCN